MRLVHSRISWLLAILPALAGCLHVDTRLKLETDGSATLTERVHFTQQLLALGASTTQGEPVAKLLERPSVERRLERMGKGVTLASHQVRDVDGGRESVSVFKVADANDLVYASPYLAFRDYGDNGLVRCRVRPLYKSNSYAGSAGQIAVTFSLLKPGKGEERPKEGEKLPPGPPPVESQIARELGPVFRDVMKGFRLRFVFESYAPIVECGFARRGAAAGVSTVDLLDFDDEDLDKQSTKFLENEEIMLDLVRGRIGSANVVDHTGGYSGNLTLPVFLPWGSASAYWHQGDDICFRPSRQLFDKYYAKDPKDPSRPAMLDYSRWAPSAPDKLVAASFDKIGWNGKAASKPDAP